MPRHGSTSALSNRREWRMMLWALIGFWCAVGLYTVSLHSSLIGYTMTRLLTSLAVSVLAPASCLTMITAAVLLTIERDFSRPVMFVACLTSLALLCLWLAFGHVADSPLERNGSQLTYGVVKAFRSTNVLGPPRLVAIPVSVLGLQTLLALLPLVALYPRVVHPPSTPLL